MKALETLTQGERELRDELSLVSARIRTETLRLLETERGVRVGSIVRNSQGDEFRITYIDTHGPEPWMVGTPRNTDGTFGIVKTYLSDDWKLVST